MELQLVLPAAVVIVPLRLGKRGGGQARVLQRGALGGLHANVTGLVHGSGALHVGRAAEHLAGVGIHPIFQLAVTGDLQLHLIVGGCLVQLRVHIRIGHIRRGQTRIGGCRLQSRRHADGHPRGPGLDQVP